MKDEYNLSDVLGLVEFWAGTTKDGIGEIQVERWHRDTVRVYLGDAGLNRRAFDLTASRTYPRGSVVS